MFNRKALEQIQKERLDLGEKKNHDYSSVADGIAICGVEGLAIRLVDKVLRARSLTLPGFKAKVTDEALRDTFIDIANYADYAVSLLDGTWGKEFDNIGTPDLNEAQKRWNGALTVKRENLQEKEMKYNVKKTSVYGSSYLASFSLEGTPCWHESKSKAQWYPKENADKLIRTLINKFPLGADVWLSLEECPHDL